MTASGSIIKNTKKRSYILTAGHLVWISPLSFSRRLFIYRPGAKVKTVTNYVATDFWGNKYENLKMVSYDKDSDLAILRMKKVKIKAIPIAKNAPKIGDPLYNISAPAGMFQPGMIPFFKGNFLGYFKYKRSKYKLALTNIPTAKGSSGSPILNSDGHIVGIVSAVHRRFHHISFSPTHKQLVNFVKKTLKGEKAYMCLRRAPTSRPTSRP